MSRESQYPGYDVWEEHQEWDEHTRSIVMKRKTPQVIYQYLNSEEAMTLQAAIYLLVDDQRLEVTTYVLQHLDESLASEIGESQRKQDVLVQKALFRDGLGRMELLSHQAYGTNFVTLKWDQQTEVLRATEQEYPEFFKKLLKKVVEAYYSHPIVWSDIGYGGPAYPRGYVRVEKGLVDPWEAKKNGKS
ncbi:gluconate 2-dehydrogenase subunit 3 family protein [Brevibacillus ginsengisoli]|uniref:gluconate 2-dehydrogenase subunit 3 family protein n=1 Tax=Brevibacillus ginsengisoli TaxID=363854 RepID=UPI003CF06928